MKKFNVQISCFPGFYESILESSDTEWNEAEYLIDGYHENYPGFNIDRDDCEFDYRGYENAISEAFAEAYSTRYPKDIVLSTKCESVVPPRNTGYGPDYRFGTDRLFVDIEVVDDWFGKMSKFIQDNQEWFSDRIREDWTSRDGFWSHMENNIEGWLRELLDEDERYIGQTLDYMIEKDRDEHSSSDEPLYYEVSIEVLDVVGAYEFISLKKEKAEELNEFIAAEEKKKRIKEFDEKHQLKLDFHE